MNQPVQPTYIQPPAPYQAQTFGTSGNFNPWAGTTDPTSGSSDPYASQISSGEQQAVGYAGQYNAAAPGLQNNINQGMQQAGQYQQSTAAYPSYPNIAGAGSQTAGISAVPQMQAPMMAGSGSGGVGASDATADTSHGFNPWSLTGEAMTRK